MAPAALLLLLPAAARAGYGDQDAAGIPSILERQVHVDTNLARIAPEAFEADYALGGCSFDDFLPDEQTPKPPLGWSAPLGAAARFHSEDMATTGTFSHDSSDGTPFDQRVASFYAESGYVGENIAVGYPDAWSVVFTGWMCSSGHRANIMLGDYHELGTGVVASPGPYYTQDFGGGERDRAAGLLMAAHDPAFPAAGEEVTFTAIHDGQAPLAVELVLQGRAVPMDLWLGTEAAGAWTVTTPLGGGCEEYYVLATTADGESRFPEEGSYLVGSDCDAPDWVPGQLGITGRDDATPEELLADVSLVSPACAAGPAPGSAWLALVGLAAAGRRRRRRDVAAGDASG